MDGLDIVAMLSGRIYVGYHPPRLDADRTPLPCKSRAVSITTPSVFDFNVLLANIFWPEQQVGTQAQRQAR